MEPVSSEECSRCTQAHAIQSHAWCSTCPQPHAMQSHATWSRTRIDDARLDMAQTRTSKWERVHVRCLLHAVPGGRTAKQLCDIAQVRVYQMRADFKAPAIEKELRLVITTSRLTDDLFWNAMNAALLPRLPKVLLQRPSSSCTANCTANSRASS